jgi:hypothetical protein
VRTNTTWGGGAGLAGLLLILTGACTISPAAPTQVQASPKAAVHSFAGGCAGTVLTDAEPPVWAQGGWSVAKGTPWPVPWAFGTHNDTLAYVFATQLVAGVGPRVDGSQNKVLWEAEDSPSGADVLVEGHPSGKSQPAVTIAGGPSITDVPTAGCWTFRLSWGSNGQHRSTINLDVLPAGTLPSRGLQPTIRPSNTSHSSKSSSLRVGW